MTNLPKAPKYEGVDPLTKGKRYHNDNTKADSTFNDAPAQVETEATERSEQTLADQEARNAEANTPSTEPTEPESTPDPETTPGTQDEVIDEAGEVDPVAVKDVEVPENTEDVQTDSTPAEGDGSDTAEAEQPTE